MSTETPQSDVKTAAPDEISATPETRESYFWLWVVCLLGLDYFSTLAYQPSIAYEFAGRIGPLATAIIALLTLVGVLPVYWYLAGRSPRGRGSLAVFEHHVRGWHGKTLLLILLGFAATDFTMLKTISLADASVHILDQHDEYRRQKVEALAEWLCEHGAEQWSPELASYLTKEMLVTLALSLVCFIFWFILRKGFNRKVLILSVPLIALYLLLNGLILGAGLQRFFEQPEYLERWWAQLNQGDWDIAPRRDLHLLGWENLTMLSFLFLPNLALGWSGFELSLILMPQVRGSVGEPDTAPQGRIRNTRKALFVAALIMSVYLLAATLVTTVLIPAQEMGPEGRAVHRAIAYLAHGGALVEGEPLLPYCGLAFGTVYDVVTVLILCLAGTSVMTALKSLLPHFLSRFGMQFRLAQRWGFMLLLFALINLVVTIFFHAEVTEQRGAYATAVLVLISAASIAAAMDKNEQRHKLKQFSLLAWLESLYFGAIAAIFVLIMVVVAVHSLIGLAIAFSFILAILAISIVSRALRADEKRTVGFDFMDDESKFLWDSLCLADFPALVPHRHGRFSHEERERRIRQEHQLAPQVDIVLLEIEIDDPSDFYQRLLVSVQSEEKRFVVKVTGCASVAHAIASVALELSRNSIPPTLHFGWPEMDMLSASWSYLAFGEGNIPWKVRELIHRLEPDPAKRPRVIMG